MKAVRLLSRRPPNNVGEVCGFDDAIADQLVADGLAEPFVEEKPKRVRLDEVKDAEPDVEPEVELDAPEEQKVVRPGRKKKYVTKA